MKRSTVPWKEVTYQMPDPGRKVLATYKNAMGMDRIIIASHIPKFYAECSCEDDCDCEYDEKRDEYYYPAGWCEMIESHDEFGFVQVGDGVITHWACLPALPGVTI